MEVGDLQPGLVAHQHPLGLGQDLGGRRQLVCVGRLVQGVVGNRAPQHEREPLGDLVARERVVPRAVRGLGHLAALEERRRDQERVEQRGGDLVDGPGRGDRRAVGHQLVEAGDLVGGQRPPEGAAAELDDRVVQTRLAVAGGRALQEVLLEGRVRHHLGGDHVGHRLVAAPAEVRQAARLIGGEDRRRLHVVRSLQRLHAEQVVDHAVVLGVGEARDLRRRRDAARVAEGDAAAGRPAGPGDHDGGAAGSGADGVAGAARARRDLRARGAGGRVRATRARRDVTDFPLAAGAERRCEEDQSPTLDLHGAHLDSWVVSSARRRIRTGLLSVQ